MPTKAVSTEKGSRRNQPAYPRIVVSKVMHKRLSQLAKREKKSMKEITDAILKVGLSNLAK